MEIQALTGRLSREEDAQRVLHGVGVEPTLDFLATRAAGKAVDYLDALVGACGTLYHLSEDRLQVAFHTLSILSKDQDAPMVPL